MRAKPRDARTPTRFLLLRRLKGRRGAPKRDCPRHGWRGQAYMDVFTARLGAPRRPARELRNGFPDDAAEPQQTSRGFARMARSYRWRSHARP